MSGRACMGAGRLASSASGMARSTSQRRSPAATAGVRRYYGELCSAPALLPGRPPTLARGGASNREVVRVSSESRACHADASLGGARSADLDDPQCGMSWRCARRARLPYCSRLASVTLHAFSTPGALRSARQLSALEASASGSTDCRPWQHSVRCFLLAVVADGWRLRGCPRRGAPPPRVYYVREAGRW